MGTPLFGRQARLTLSIPVSTPGDYSGTLIDEVEINGGGTSTQPGLRVRFKIEKSDQKNPNKSQVIVSNLAPNTRASLQRKGVKVALDAGYQASGMSRIFLGDLRTCDHVRNVADWDTTMHLGDGERAYRYARVTESFAAGTSAAAVLRRLAGLSGLSVGNVPDQAAALRVVFGQGYTASGRWSEVFGRLVNSLGLTWSIQSGAIQILAPGQALAASIPLITPTTGLIGSPEMGTPEKVGKPALLKMKALLFPAVPGTEVQLQSERYNGLVRARKVTIEGDTHGSEWYTTIEGVIVT